MKFLSLLALSVSSLAATITAQPFKFTVLNNTKDYDISMELTLACRYEKFVISDSSQYEVFFKEVPLKISSKNGRTTIENQYPVEHEVTGIFKSNKSCYSISSFIVKSKKYSVGWANQFSRPISLKIYENSPAREYSEFDASELVELVADKEVKFVYKASSNQVIVKMSFDDEVYRSMSTFASTTVYRFEDTNFPHPLVTAPVKWGQKLL